MKPVPPSAKPARRQNSPLPNPTTPKNQAAHAYSHLSEGSVYVEFMENLAGSYPPPPPPPPPRRFQGATTVVPATAGTGWRPTWRRTAVGLPTCCGGFQLGMLGYGCLSVNLCLLKRPTFVLFCTSLLRVKCLQVSSARQGADERACSCS